MICRHVRRLAFAVALALVAAPAAHGQFTASQPISFSISAINQIAFSGTPTLTVTTATPGSSPSSVTNATATWAVTTNQTGAKITASIPTIMPAGVTLSSSLAAPAGATSAGFKPLTTVAVDLVTGITKVAQGAMVVSYRLDATPAAGVVTTQSRMVTYTITGGT
jgi:hypothetical protein